MALQAGVQVIVQSERPGQEFDCLGFTGLPIVNPAFIALASAGTPQARANLDELHSELVRELHVIAPQIRSVVLPCRGLPPGPGPAGCHAQMEPDCQKLLVLVGDETLPLSVSPFHQPWLTGSPTHRVLPVYGVASRTSVWNLLPIEYRRLNVEFWSRSIAEVIPAILALSGLTAENPRIFISYRQKDAPALAMQLFDALSHQNFDAFLDHFRIPPGVNFQARLTQELGNKSMVLLIESEHILDSEWTTYEINVAKACALGIFALHVPGGVYVDGVDSAIRLELDATQFVGGVFSSATELQPASLDAIIDRVRREHDRALVRRRQILRESLEGALLEQGLVQPYLTPAGGMRVQSHGGQEYLVWLTPRPPELPDFYSVHGQAASPLRGVVIGLARLMEPSRLAQTDWLAGLSQVKLVDEGHMKQAAAQMARGNL
jgi:hypothetical protein